MLKYSTQVTGWMQPRACHYALMPQGAEKNLVIQRMLLQRRRR
jgi:hypothetical protein